MKLVVCLAALLAAVSAMPNAHKWGEDNVLRFVPINVPEIHEPAFQQKWNAFKDTHGKKYETEEDAKRQDIFHKNLKVIAMHNYLHDKGVKSYTLGVNEFADMENKEFVAMMNGLLPRDYSKNPTPHLDYLSPAMPVSVPDTVDWRDHGYVTEVKNQGSCGSCWSFSTTGALEGQHMRKLGTLVSLSEQNLVDCSEKWGNHGCNGGLMDYAFQYIKDNQGIDKETAYPYKAQEGVCHFSPGKDVGATDAGYIDVATGDEEKLKEALATIGPISVAIDASHSSFQLYQSGVYDEPECSSTQLDHGVLSIGYGTEDGQDYWLVKNSWGEQWGDQGYVKMARNKDNQCGVATQASYPLV